MVTGSIGKYQVERHLGGGGMAEVFLARVHGAAGFSRRMAIKRILPGYSDHATFASLCVSEAQLSSQLTHPNIVSVLDFEHDADHGLFLVMELVEGKDLSKLLETGTPPTSLVIYLVAEVLRGLGYAHNLPAADSGIRGVIHRDVSPHNVLLSWEGAVKVADFGIAKSRAASNASASVMVKGKTGYMSPEQANGEPLDGRSDLFAVGVMLWEMLVGRSLFSRATTQESLAALFFSTIPPPSATCSPAVTRPVMAAPSWWRSWKRASPAGPGRSRASRPWPPRPSPGQTVPRRRYCPRSSRSPPRRRLHQRQAPAELRRRCCLRSSRSPPLHRGLSHPPRRPRLALRPHRLGLRDGGALGRCGDGRDCHPGRRPRPASQIRHGRSPARRLGSLISIQNFRVLEQARFI
jgi:serine/threonine protein kinase